MHRISFYDVKNGKHKSQTPHYSNQNGLSPLPAAASQGAYSNRLTLTCCANVISVMSANRYVVLVLGVVLAAIFKPDLSFETTLPRFESGSSGLNKRNGLRFAKSMDRVDSALHLGLRGPIPEIALQVQPSYIPTPP